MIDSFNGRWAFLSNFSPSFIRYEGQEYPTVEHAFQAAKSLDPKERQRIAQLPTPGEAKREGRKLKLRPDWDILREPIMEELLNLKFGKPIFRARLLCTEDEELVEGNYRGDTFWGQCDGKGENRLGRLLMKIRRQARQEIQGNRS